MSIQLNNVVVAGNLTRDPELRFLANERCVAHFGIAVNRRWKDRDTGEQRDEVTFIDCEAWGKTAELIGKYLGKGSGAYVEGRLKLESWQDKDGKNRTRMKVLVDNVQFTSAKRDGPTGDGKVVPPDGAPASPTGEVPAAKPTGHTAVGHDEPPF
jgi:single-strand DNA-binding protein